MHVLILVTDVELCVNDFSLLSSHFQNQSIVISGIQIMEDRLTQGSSKVAEGSNKVDKKLNDKMVKFTLSKFPKKEHGPFSTQVGKGGPKVTFNINRCYDIDNGLELYGNDNDHILFVSGGVDVVQVKSLGTICNSIIKNPDALAIGNIHYSKQNWFRIIQNLVYINIDNWKKAKQPWFGSWQNFTYVGDTEEIIPSIKPFVIDRNLPVVDQSYNSEGVLRINNTGKREDIKMTIRRAPGWNFIDVAYKNNLEIGSWPYEIVKKWPWLYDEEMGMFNDNS